jgi:3-oxoacyl-[acyl-carrier protein] reductase
MGIGLEVCRAIAADGARVIVAARGETALAQAIRSLGGEGHEAVRLDVSDAAAWPSAMERIDAGGPLDGLVTAAAVIDPIGGIGEVSMDAFAATIATNVVGTALSLHHALPRLEASGGRAVTFSGGGGTSPLTRFDAYAASKAAVVRLSENVAGDTAVEINCVSPGFVATRMHNSTLAAGPDGAGADYYAKTQRQLDEGGFPVAEAAALVVFLLGDDARGITGRVISAQWDPWREPAFQERLRRDPDLARLRRIDDQLFVSKS